MTTARRWILFCILATFVTGAFSVFGDTVEITVNGVVEYNQIGAPPLGNVVAGEPATLTFTVDSDVFTNGSGPTRGYEIDANSFAFTLGSETLPLANPFPAGQTPYFVVVNDFPAVDGFWVTSNVNSPAGVPLDQVGAFGDFLANFYVTYGGDTLPSLDILDALGDYDFGGLSVFNFTVDDGPFNAMGLIFENMTIGTATPPTSFIRGDADGDGSFNGLLDGLWILNFQFSAGPPPPCLEAADADGDGGFNGLLDGLYVLNHQFSSGPAPSAPYPDCGPDPDPGTSLGCDMPPSCP